MGNIETFIMRWHVFGKGRLYTGDIIIEAARNNIKIKIYTP